MLTILVLLMIAWVCVGAQFVIQRRREGRTESSVAYFRQQLSTLERATPGSTMRKSLTGPVPVIKMEPATNAPRLTGARKRRRDVLFGLMGLTVFSAILRLISPGFLTTSLLLLSILALGAYVWALRSRQLSIQTRSGAHPAAQPAEMVHHDHEESVTVRTGTVYRPSSLAN